MQLFPSLHLCIYTTTCPSRSIHHCSWAGPSPTGRKKNTMSDSIDSSLDEDSKETGHWSCCPSLLSWIYQRAKIKDGMREGVGDGPRKIRGESIGRDGQRRWSDFFFLFFWCWPCRCRVGARLHGRSSVCRRQWFVASESQTGQHRMRGRPRQIAF